MNLQQKRYLPWRYVKQMNEDALNEMYKDCWTFSITERGELDIGVFIGKDGRDSDYEVRVYKSSKDDKYVPHEEDNIKRFEDNEGFITFFFEKFEYARAFVQFFAVRHEEYKCRPLFY